MIQLFFKSVCYAAVFLLSVEIHAANFGVYIAGGFWSTEYSGFVTDNKTVSNSINLQDDLRLNDSLQSFFYIYIEQKIPYAPNYRLGRTSISTSGSSTLNKSLIFQGSSYQINEQVTSKLNLEHIEAVLYWKLFETNYRVDLGFAIKDFSGEVSVLGAVSGKSSVSLSETIPLLYASFKTQLPLTALTVGMNGSFLVIEDAALSDIIAFVRYETDSYVGIEVGYRNFQLRLNSTELKTNVKITGLYLSGFVYF